MRRFTYRQPTILVGFTLWLGTAALLCAFGPNQIASPSAEKPGAATLVPVADDTVIHLPEARPTAEPILLARQ